MSEDIKCYIRFGLIMLFFSLAIIAIELHFSPNRFSKVEVGQVWTTEWQDPFDKGYRYEVTDVKDGYVRWQSKRLGSGSDKAYRFKRYKKLISNKESKDER